MGDTNSTATRKINQERKIGGAKAITQSEFLRRCIEQHGDRYDYSKTVYKDHRSNVTVTCKKHGDFNQIASVHTHGSGCPDCAGVKKMGLAGFIERARAVHGDKYCYESVVYKNVNSHVNLYCKPCKNHFKQTVTSHLKGASCPKCRLKPKISTDDFIKRSVVINGDKYTYGNTTYTRASEKLIITCRLHGDFTQQAASHLRGTQCPSCAKKSQGWRRSDYLETCKAYNGLSSLYVLRCVGADEVFYKIGITCHSVSKRYRGSGIPYDYSVMHKIVGEAGFIWDLEIKLHDMSKASKYTPKIKFDGFTECFSGIPKSISELISRLSDTTQLQLIA